MPRAIRRNAQLTVTAQAEGMSLYETEAIEIPREAETVVLPEVVMIPERR